MMIPGWVQLVFVLLLGAVLGALMLKVFFGLSSPMEGHKGGEKFSKTQAWRRLLGSETGSIQAAVSELIQAAEQQAANIIARAAEAEARAMERERLLKEQLERLTEREASLKARYEELERQQEELNRRARELERLQEQWLKKIEQVSELTKEEAKSLLMKQVEEESLIEATNLSQHIMQKARDHAEREARRIISIAIQRLAVPAIGELTTCSVALNGADLKGRIIGRDGRNIRAFELATGVTVIIDEASDAVVLSGFDPIRREIAKLAMERLIREGRIYPARIEEVVREVKSVIEQRVREAGEEAVSKVGLPPLKPEISEMLGRLKFRHSYTQNLLEHSIEVAHICGLLAAELGSPVFIAKRAGLLHDIGKAVSHEVQGSHAEVGAKFLQSHGEPEEIVNAVASHHGEISPISEIGALVSAADAMSAARLGARSESTAHYLQRIEYLEQLAKSFPGVEKCYAVQAGRELLVLVRPDEVSDEQARVLARNLARKIETELEYPGQIRVTVIRETRCVEYAR